MRITGVVMVAMVGRTCWAGAVPADKPQVMVCMAPTADIRLEKRAKAVSFGIFAGIGVKIQWHGLSKCPRREYLSLSQTRRQPA
jgi:hypothetical protein